MTREEAKALLIGLQTIIRNEALEEAAKVAETFNTDPPSFVPTLIAEQIRSLIEKG